ncbi:unnamed protein product [Blepharisma stoltei]|uniref:Uncharacterized protein n=1 Tax=Blepharisma stoltei TaxID=1481888 RepID=A0AAU9K9Z7_9CILI|nr:unnamed protein product [Blepharisma stoltei]
MTSILLSHAIEHKNSIESKYLPYIGISTPNYYHLRQLLVYNLEIEKSAVFYGDFDIIKIVNLPNDEILLVQSDIHCRKNTTTFWFLHKGIRREINHNSPIISALYYDEYVYLFFGSKSWKVKISDIERNSCKKLRIINMPKSAHFWAIEFLSCVGFFDKMLIASSYKNWIFMYDKKVNSWSELPLILRNGYKILAVHQFKIYVILFPGLVYENLGDLRLWKVVSQNFCCINYPDISTYIFKGNSLVIADYKNFYYFNLDKVKIEKIEIIIDENNK